MWVYRTNEIYHTGVKGMKWGVRRYQNPDGTLTAAGRKRYDVAYDKRGNVNVIERDSGKKISSKDQKNFLRDMKKNDRSKYNEYNHYQKMTKSGMTYIGNSTTTALLVSGINNMGAGSRSIAKERCAQILSQYANTYLDDLN